MSFPNPASWSMPAKMRHIMGGVVSSNLPLRVVVTDDAGERLAAFMGQGRGSVFKADGDDAACLGEYPEVKNIRLSFRILTDDDSHGVEATVISATSLPLGEGQYVRTLVTEDTINGQKHSAIFHIIVLSPRSDSLYT